MEYEDLDRGDRAMPTAGSTKKPSVEPDPAQAKEVFPVQFDKDYLDFRPQENTEEVIPKASSAPVPVVTPTLPVGLEDVSEEDSVTSAPETNAEKDTMKESSIKESNSSQTSSKET